MPKRTKLVSHNDVAFMKKILFKELICLIYPKNEVEGKIKDFSQKDKQSHIIVDIVQHIGRENASAIKSQELRELKLNLLNNVASAPKKLLKYYDLEFNYNKSKDKKS